MCSLLDHDALPLVRFPSNGYCEFCLCVRIPRGCDTRSSGRAVGWCGCVGYVCEAHVIGSGLGSGQGRPALGDRSIMVSSGPGFDGKRAELAVEASPNTRLVYSDLRSSDTNNVNSRSRSPVNRSFRTLMPSSYEMGARPKHYNNGATAPLPSWCMGAKPKHSSRTMSILPKTTTVNADR